MGIARWLNRTVGFFVFSLLDIADFLLCYTYKTLDYFLESERKPCYCSSPPEAQAKTGKIIVSERGEYSKVVSLTRTKIHFDEISETLYSRGPSLLTRLSKLVRSVKCFNYKGLIMRGNEVESCDHDESNYKKKISKGKKRLMTLNSTVVEKSSTAPRWSDCHCSFCTSWLSSSNRDSLFVKVQQPKDMGLHSYSQTSSSSLQVWSAGEPEVNFRPPTSGIPDKCFCGGETVLKISTTDETRGRIFIGCRDHKEGDRGRDHLMKWWDEAITQELQEIKERASYAARQDTEDMLWFQQELSKVKAQMEEVRQSERRRLVLVNNMLVAGIIFIVVLVSLVI